MVIPEEVEEGVDDDGEKSGLETNNEDSELRLKSKAAELEEELRRVYSAYGELKGLHEKLWNKYVDERIST